MYAYNRHAFLMAKVEVIWMSKNRPCSIVDVWVAGHKKPLLEGLEQSQFFHWWSKNTLLDSWRWRGDLGKGAISNKVFLIFDFYLLSFPIYQLAFNKPQFIHLAFRWGFYQKRLLPRFIYKAIINHIQVQMHATTTHAHTQIWIHRRWALRHHS